MFISFFFIESEHAKGEQVYPVYRRSRDLSQAYACLLLASPIINPLQLQPSSGLLL